MGRKIRLTKERWAHITSPANLHPYMVNYLEEVRMAIINPDAVVPNKFDDSKANYYKYLKVEKKYLLIAVKYLNGDGFVMTSFKVRNIKRK
ncbi:MAG: hypothetical protein KJ879_02245 [Nanoarchaeota archaeon]|nr:hypothetical protein [Nanoarchaeota archaeon]